MMSGLRDSTLFPFRSLFCGLAASLLGACGTTSSLQAPDEDKMIDFTRSETPDATTLVLGAAITQYDEGDTILRWMVGFAAGNVNSNARLELVDGQPANPSEHGR